MSTQGVWKRVHLKFVGVDKRFFPYMEMLAWCVRGAMLFGLCEWLPARLVGHALCFEQ
jgi:hypothetical protein